MPSSASGTSARICAEIVTMSWHSCGFCLCGMVELPITPGGAGSATSPNSTVISV